VKERLKKKKKKMERKKKPFTFLANTMSKQQVFPGITKPLCLEGPTEEDIEMTRILEDTLRHYNMYENQERTEQRLDTHYFYFLVFS
jgi:hypothetical protein